jgi:hypothetical protein
MTDAMDAAVPWLASGTVAIFLIVCVWHNRRTGYQKARAEKMPLGEAIALIKQSLSFGDDALPVASRPVATQTSFTSTQTEQLLSLNSALQSNRPSEIEEPVRADAFVAEALIEEPSVRN